MKVAVNTIIDEHTLADWPDSTDHILIGFREKPFNGSRLFAESGNIRTLLDHYSSYQEMPSVTAAMIVTSWNVVVVSFDRGSNPPGGGDQ